MKTLIAFSDARRIVLDAVAPGPVDHVALEAAVGRTLAAPIESTRAVPPFDNAAMDGFALRHADVADGPTSLRIIGTVPAGTTPDCRVTAGTCAQIMTGAPLPPGADTVVRMERTAPAEDADRVAIQTVPPRHANVRRAGEDMQPGEVVIAAGTVLEGSALRVAAALGHGTVPVRAVPSVAVLATGDELVHPGEPLGPGQIYDANSPALMAQVHDAGGRVMHRAVARDDRGTLRATLETARRADMLVVTGGISVGERDLVRQELEAMGTTWHFWKVKQRPGKPVAFGVLDGTPVFGLPGNPVAAGVCFEAYVRPALAAMLGREPACRPLVTATLTAPARKKPGPYYLARGIAAHDAAGQLQVRPTDKQNSHISTSLLAANCLIHLPEAMEHPTAGTRVQIEWLH